MKWYITVLSQETLGTVIEEMYLAILDKETKEGEMVGTHELRADLNVFLYEYLKKFVVPAAVMDICLYIMAEGDLKLIEKVNEQNYVRLFVYKRRREIEFNRANGLT